MRSFGGGRPSKDHIGSQGGGGEVKMGQKKDHIIFECSLKLTKNVHKMVENWPKLSF